MQTRADRWVRHASRGGGKSSRVRAIALLVPAAVSLVLLSQATARAQTPHPTISVGATIPAEPATQSPLSIRVGPPDAVPKGSFVRVRGLPPTVALSEGYSIAPGSWAIPIAALPSLKITVPAAATGKSEVAITVVGADGTILAEATSVLVVAAPSPENKARPGTAPATILRAGTPEPAPPGKPERLAPPVSTEGQPKMSPEQRERAQRMLKRGDEHLAEGGIAQARLLYERAAEAGLAQGAMALAGTYDPAELRRLGVRGLQPDRATALRWYERARQLGAAEAEQRLRRLGAN